MQSLSAFNLYMLETSQLVSLMTIEHDMK